ncbi:MAG: hypothetical protein JSU01_22510 [Bacteroidetes bacterium]|nr:hypothetical protein [Bacteroidota bacterium]
MKKVLGAIALITIFAAFSWENKLKGTWEYMGGLYNGKKDNPPTEYALHRTYDDMHFNAYALEKGYKPERYEAGDYTLKGDTCIEIQTYSSQPTKLKNIPVRYLFAVRNDSLILKGTLPTGMVVEEYWKKVK